MGQAEDQVPHIRASEPEGINVQVFHDTWDLAEERTSHPDVPGDKWKGDGEYRSL